MADYRETLLRLKDAVEGRYDHVLPDSVISVCGGILWGETDDMPFRGFHGESVCIAKAMDFHTFSRVDGGMGNIVYDPKRRDSSWRLRRKGMAFRPCLFS